MQAALEAPVYGIHLETCYITSDWNVFLKSAASNRIEVPTFDDIREIPLQRLLIEFLRDITIATASHVLGDFRFARHQIDRICAPYYPLLIQLVQRAHKVLHVLCSNPPVAHGLDALVRTIASYCLRTAGANR